MFQYPYGDEQQLNLNWIINEIIQLHKQLDPDYTEPAFSQIYPFSNTAELNLDWILDELKKLKELAPVVPPTEEIDEIGQALLAGAYDAETEYQKNDYIVQDGKAYRATEATTGAFDATKWREVKIAEDLAIITRWADATNTYINNLAASQVNNDSDVSGTTIKDALNTLLHAVPALTTDNVTNESDVPGETSTAALNALLGSLNSVESSIAIVANGDTHVAIASGQYVYIKNHNTLADGLYKAIAAIPQNAALSISNVSAVSSGGLNNIIEDSGWTNVTYEAGFKTYGAGGNPVKYRKINGIVNLVGLLSTTQELAVGAHTICYLPSGFRPSTSFISVCQGSGMNKWVIGINTQGEVYAERYGIDTAIPVPNAAYLPINVTFMAQ